MFLFVIYVNENLARKEKTFKKLFKFIFNIIKIFIGFEIFIIYVFNDNTCYL